MGSGTSLEALRIPLKAVATKHGLTSWEGGREKEEREEEWMDRWMEEEMNEREKREGETE